MHHTSKLHTYIHHVICYVVCPTFPMITIPSYIHTYNIHIYTHACTYMHIPYLIDIYNKTACPSNTLLFDRNLDRLLVRHRVLVPLLLGVVRLPATRGEDVLVSLVPTAQADLTRVRFVLLNFRVVYDADIVVHVKVEQRSALAPRFGHDEVVERVMVRDDQVLFHVHQVVGARRLQLVEFFPQILERFLEQLGDAVSLAHAHLAAVTGTVPVAVRDVDLLALDLLLCALPLLAQFFSETTQRDISIVESLMP